MSSVSYTHVEDKVRVPRLAAVLVPDVVEGDALAQVGVLLAQLAQILVRDSVPLGSRRAAVGLERTPVAALIVSIGTFSAMGSEGRCAAEVRAVARVPRRRRIPGGVRARRSLMLVIGWVLRQTGLARPTHGLGTQYTGLGAMFTHRLGQTMERGRSGPISRSRNRPRSKEDHQAWLQNAPNYGSATSKR